MGLWKVGCDCGSRLKKATLVLNNFDSYYKCVWNLLKLEFLYTYVCVFCEVKAEYMYMYSAPTSQKAHCIPITKIIVWEKNSSENYTLHGKRYGVFFNYAL